MQHQSRPRTPITDEYLSEKIELVALRFIVNAAVTWRRCQEASPLDVSEEEVSGAWMRFLDILNQHPKLREYNGRRPAERSHGPDDNSPVSGGPVDAVKTCPGESPPAGSPSTDRPRMGHGPSREDRPLWDIAKGTTGFGGEE
jgi:hypothetical protein